MKVKEKSPELEEMFEEMFSSTNKKEPKQEEPKQEEQEWPKLGKVAVDIVDTYKESGLKCCMCVSMDAMYSEHYKEQWCLNCWF